MFMVEMGIRRFSLEDLVIMGFGLFFLILLIIEFLKFKVLFQIDNFNLSISNWGIVCVYLGGIVLEYEFSWIRLGFLKEVEGDLQ